MTSFEDKLFKQPAYWVSELTINSLVPSVHLQLISNPDTKEVECNVTFFKVRGITSNFHGHASQSINDYLCTLLGIENSDDIKDTKYIITTDTTEVSFITSVEPKIEWLDPEKPFQKWNREIINVENK